MDVLCARAEVSLGHAARMRQVFAKAKRKERVVIGAIGGSITAGALAGTQDKRYVNQVAAWWRATFPGAKIDLVNAGIGATGSDYGAMRVQRDLLRHRPDFVIIEFAVNDGSDDQAVGARVGEQIEGLVRQILGAAGQPAAMMLFTMTDKGRNVQKTHARVGSHYGLPMVSYRDALWPEIEAQRLKWTDISPDVVHPNDRGHTYAAGFATAVLGKMLREFQADARLLPIEPLPGVLIGTTYEHTSLFEGEALKPTGNAGWIFDPKAKCWKADKPGSTIEFQIEGRAVLCRHWRIRGGMGRVRAQVEGGSPVALEGWFDQTWGGYGHNTELARFPQAARRRVRFELLDEKSGESTGHEFRIMALGGAGLAVGRDEPPGRDAAGHGAPAQ